jgi:hypothetical protein
MSHSNRGLNEPFYKWIDDVRRAMRKEKELQEKLEFFNMKLIGYKGVSYDRIGTSGSRSSGDSELLYWLDKIDSITRVIKRNAIIINNYFSFRGILEERLSVHLDLILNCQRGKKNQYRMTNSIIREWFSDAARNGQNI